MPGLDAEPPQSHGRIKSACEGSLRRLRTDYIDLYQVHAPDPSTPIDEMLEALSQLQSEGKVREIGCSNYPVEAFIDALSVSDARGLPRFASHQLRYNLLAREVESTELPLCSVYGVAVLAYSPLAGGLLTDRQAALAWVLARPGVTSAIVGASRPEQLQETLVARPLEEMYLCA